MSKRLIIPTKQTMIVAAGIGEVIVPKADTSPVRVLTYLVIEGPPGARKGRVEITDEDEGLSIFKDPKPGDADILLDFYTFEMRIPMNGVYKIKIFDAQDNGDYSIYTAVEERQRNV